MDWLQQASQDIYGTSYEEQVRKYSAFRLNQYLEAAGVTDYQVDENGDKAFNYKKIAALLSDYLIQLAVEGSTKVRDKFYGSSFGSCIRQQSYYLLLAPSVTSEYNPLWLLTAHSGNFIHEFTQGLMTTIPDFLVQQPITTVDQGLRIVPSCEIRMGNINLFDAQSLWDLHNISIRFDFTCQMPGLTMGDIKSDDEKYWYVEKLRPFLYEKNDKAVKQVLSAIKFYRDPQGRQPKYGMVFRVGRSSFKQKVYMFTYDEYADAWVDKELEALLQATELMKEFNINLEPNTAEWVDGLSNPYYLYDAQSKRGCFMCPFVSICPEGV